MRWLVLDEVLAVEKGKRSLSRSRVPSAFCSPEFLMIEMMAQTGALLVGAESDFSRDLVFAKIESVEFSPGFEAGDPIEIESHADQISAEGGWLEARVSGPRGLIAQSKLLLMSVGHLIPGKTVPVTFHKNFMEHFKIRDKVITASRSVS